MFSAELKKGSTEMLILSLLDGRPRHGYEIGKLIEARSGGRLTYALGYTGLGVGASRWAAGIVRDFILRPDSDLLRLRFVQSRPIPFPPEPLRYATVQAVRHELARADRNEGRRGLLLRTLDALGIGFDS